MKIGSNFLYILGIILLIFIIYSFRYINDLISELESHHERQAYIYAEGIRSTINETDATFIFHEFVVNNKHIPAILIDDKNMIIDYVNVEVDPELFPEQKNMFLLKKLREMRDYKPIEIELPGGGKQYLYYGKSEIITRLIYYPYVQNSVVFIMLVAAFFVFRFYEQSNKDKILLGLSKETAHQLGTPTSAISASIDYLKEEKIDNKEILSYLEQDVDRLEMIIDRFSTIGSDKIDLVKMNVTTIISNTIGYLKHRFSSRIHISIILRSEEHFIAPLNEPLFSWVIENMCKNAVDAMKGIGNIKIYVDYVSRRKKIIIDIEDNGKGIDKRSVRKVFAPGYTTKNNGWGIGLSLCKRIIEKYHSGKVFVLKSAINKGTTFRIILPNR